ncbi:hypothetical protein GCM10025878_13190 [Leuconostoc gasicomitatum]|uniref:Uncharacterized protein n=2 Tax=Leuconostoc TaxID=1243 RepID=A0A9Q3XTW6_9LACO|nr:MULTISPECIES: hypothetical protein [Leuconostoc]MBZ5945164.1 hypothetical protein [Leuconostoc gasicomitatum]MBZ5957249.1 hypothetical protein [Leuconostoc gasicomitatum]MBZ5958591.1 hypothetical protein [Leuconostoc gasicomitatum]MBZ5962146.1 hypothetical protein [Leuconostoc gasicomitatum]MBZ5966201.1 hypothetical protein [Leuconostoc gasicomitatum]
MFTLNNQPKSSKINFSKTVDLNEKEIELKSDHFYENINEQIFKDKKVKQALFMLSKV